MLSAGERPTIRRRRSCVCPCKRDSPRLAIFHRHDFVFQTHDRGRGLPGPQRLQFPQDLDTAPFTPDQIAAVAPICDRGFALAAEAFKLGAGTPPTASAPGTPEALDVFAEYFASFALLDPSLITALAMHPGIRHYFGPMTRPRS
jgi:hypothetical protein